MAAVQYLFAHDLHGGKPSEIEESAFWELHSVKGAARAFAADLIQGVLSNRDEIDEWIAKLLENFSFERLAVVDRNVMRLAAYELAHCTSVPAPVILNEAIEVARMLSAGQSSAFVNGILHKLALLVRPKTSLPDPREDGPIIA